MVRVVARVAMCPCHDIKLEACVEFLWGENIFFMWRLTGGRSARWP